MYFVYILFSEALNKYYIGSTSDSLDERTNYSLFLGKKVGFSVIF